jgi:Na+/H+ antiporter NhaD/arsenite permease-like protein
MENTSLYEGGVNYRLMAIDQFKERFPESPLFGFGDYDLTVSKLTGYMPHQAPLEIAAVHGLIPAVILTILLILGILPMFKKMKINRFKRNNYQESEAFFNNDIFGLCIVFGWVVFFIAFTNKMAGQTLTWIALAIAVLPIFISIDNHNRQIPPVART